VTEKPMITEIQNQDQIDVDVATNLGRIILSALAQAFNSQGVYP
jgi:hypothetical protein